jgi:hypothetical protein
LSLSGTEIIRCCFLAFAITTCVLTDPAIAEGEHSRRAATELLVLRGDIQKLTKNNLSGLHIKGLKDRIGGGLAGLEIMLRLADQEAGKKPIDYIPDLNNIRKSWGAFNLTALADGLDRLQTIHPFAASGILPAKATISAMAAAKNLHEDLCAACHDEPDLEVPRPAFNLFKEAQQLPESEFAARMSVGVRGDRITGIDNPLTDAQISALISYYKTTGFSE